MSSTIETLRRMANQIARNLEIRGHDAAVAATTEHIWKFWDPGMKAKIFADDPANLTPIAREAIARLAKGALDPVHARAAEFNTVNEVGHSDAG